MGKKSGSGFGMNNLDYISDSLETWIRNLKKFGSEMEKIWIRGGKIQFMDQGEKS
jgi:hypothetical protein